MKVEKFYFRTWQGRPETELIEHARRGFWTLGIETAVYEGDEGLTKIEDLGPTVGVCGYIGDVHRALRQLGRPIPVNVDYPDSLRDFLGRPITASTLGDVRRRWTTGRLDGMDDLNDPIFIKPQEHKLFGGFVYDGSTHSRHRVVTIGDDTPVFTSPVLRFVSEYRAMLGRRDCHGFGHDEPGDIVFDVRRYKGDWSVAPSKRVVEKAVRESSMADDRPASYCLDFGVTDAGKTLLIEMNDGFAFGHYGLDSTTYAEMLAARWYQMAS